jgi:hypothetical protein
MKSQKSCGPRLGKIVHQISGVVNFVYDLYFRCVSPLERYHRGDSFLGLNHAFDYLAKMSLFWLPLSTMKSSRVPFTHICEWKSRSPSSGLSGSPGWSLVVETVALGSASMICLPLFGSSSESKPKYDLEAFTSSTNDFFE